MWYGYAGKVLKVNLTDSKVEVESLDREAAQNFMGGSGLGAKYLYDEVDPSVDGFLGSAIDRVVTGYVVDEDLSVLDVMTNICQHMLAVGIEKANGNVGLYAYIPTLEPEAEDILCKDNDLIAAEIDLPRQRVEIHRAHGVRAHVQRGQRWDRAE